jgi:hypothetical protein
LNSFTHCLGFPQQIPAVFFCFGFVPCRATFCTFDSAIVLSCPADPGNMWFIYWLKENKLSATELQPCKDFAGVAA